MIITEKNLADIYGGKEIVFNPNGERFVAFNAVDGSIMLYRWEDRNDDVIPFFISKEQICDGNFEIADEKEVQTWR